MPLSWNEIKSRAIAFSKEWDGTHNEDADAKSFLDAFFNVFGITRKKIATFEHRIKKLNSSDGYIDLLWKGTLLIEMKSKGKDLNKAYQQAKEYLQTLPEHELPQYVLVSDFDIFRLYDLVSETTHEFVLKDLVKHVQHFGFIAGYIKQTFKEQDPVNIKAANLMGKLHDRLEAIGYAGHDLEVYLVRLLFCLFAEDSTIFEKDLFTDFITNRTAADGSDLAARLSELFYVLNTPVEKRLKTLDEHLARFPYVNGKLFKEPLPPAAFDTAMRNSLLECCSINWGNISPAIFGSMFQSVMNPQERRNLGAHYTSEKNILKLIKPLVLDELWAEFEQLKKVKNNKAKQLNDFHKKISNLKFLDPACGCGNFLVITYRELRLLEIEILRELIDKNAPTLDINIYILLNVDMMYGIEYEEFPAQIAQVAMWLIDHQMNMLISEEFGQYFVRLPLKKSATIVHGNALQIDWESVVPKNELSYILGNPPFIGFKHQNDEQKKDLDLIFDEIKGLGVLDYVTGWYVKAAKYITGTNIKVAFVSTNSIVQGEQTSILWGHLLNNLNIKLHFAHRTFKWNNEAKNNAAVYCVIIGFAAYDTNNKVIYDYVDINGEPHEIKAKNINPYLVDAPNIFIAKRSSPICNVPKMTLANLAYDFGYLTFNDEEKNTFIINEPLSKKYFRPVVSAYEFLNNKERWCLWMIDISPTELHKMPSIIQRLSVIKTERLKSTRSQTLKAAKTPYLFAEIRQPNSNYLAFPITSSESRRYIPIGFFTPHFITSAGVHVVPNASLYDFGLLTSLMHMAWVKTVCGRMKSDFRYSNTIVYNNYPFPKEPTEKQQQAVENAAQKVLDARALFPDSSLADLYNPLTMPPALVKAHNALDKAVDACYSKQNFTTDAQRMEFLFSLYEQYTADLFSVEKGKKKRKS